MRYIMRKVFVLFFFAIILLCGCSEDKYECECCHTYKTDSQVDYYADEDMTICKDCITKEAKKSHYPMQWRSLDDKNTYCVHDDGKFEKIKNKIPLF